MDVIDPLKASFVGSSHNQNQKVNKKKEPKKTRFSSLLGVKESGESGAAGAPNSLSLYENLDLEKLIDDVHLAGEKLKEKPVFSVMNEYKEAVRKFLGCIVEQVYIAEDKISGINILKRKKFTMIKVIDSKLESLASGILQNQMSQIEILTKVDEIRGLLIDLMS